LKSKSTARAQNELTNAGGTTSLIANDYPDLDVATALLIREDAGEHDVRRSVLRRIPAK
jgi:hypothetical protein